MVKYRDFMDNTGLNESNSGDKKELEAEYLGREIKIIELRGEDPDSGYNGRTGVVEYVDDAGQLHGTWGGLAVIPGEDIFEII